MNSKILFYHLKTSGKTIVEAFLIYVAIVVALGIIFGTMVSDPSNNSHIVSGNEFLFAVLFFVLALAQYRGELRLMLQFGTSRNTKWIATFLSVFILSIGVSAISLVSGIIFKTTMPSMNYLNLFEMSYPKASFITYWFMGTLLFLCSYYFGLLVNLIYARLNKVATIIVSVAVPVSIPLLSILDYTFWGSALSQIVVEFYKWITPSSTSMTVFLLSSFVITCALTYLLNRRINLTSGVGNPIS